MKKKKTNNVVVLLEYKDDFLQVFYNKTNKKEYDLQIWQYTMRYTNIMAIKDIILLKKAQEEEKLSKCIVETTLPAKMARASSLVDLARIYKWAMSNVNLDIAEKLGLTDIK